MNKISPTYDDEIDLISLLKIIWDGKIKILLITIISFLIGQVYNYQTPNNYLNSLDINPSKTSEFSRYDYLKKLIAAFNSIDLNNSNLSNLSNQQSLISNSNMSGETSRFYLPKFINELKDYEEFLLSLKNTKKIQENLSKFNIEDQKKEMFKYAKLLNVESFKNNDNESYYVIYFKWHDPDEAKIILQNTLNLTSKNLRKTIDKELLQIMEFEKKFILNKDAEKLDYLLEQSAIAKELNIQDNQIDNVNLSQSNVSLNINTTNIAYYLRGSKAIDKEVELIKGRNYGQVKFLEKEIDSFLKENINMANYNVYLMNSKSLKDTKLILVTSIILGLIVSVIYVFASNVFQSKKKL